MESADGKRGVLDFTTRFRIALVLAIGVRSKTITVHRYYSQRSASLVFAVKPAHSGAITSR